MSQKQLKNLIFTVEENNNRWEDKPSSISFDDIDEDTLKSSLIKVEKKAEFHTNIQIKKKF